MDISVPSARPTGQSDDFQQAAAAAKAEAGAESWLKMSPREQAQAIYSHLRRIDAERALATVRRA